MEVNTMGWEMAILKLYIQLSFTVFWNYWPSKVSLCKCLAFRQPCWPYSLWVLSFVCMLYLLYIYVLVNTTHILQITLIVHLAAWLQPHVLLKPVTVTGIWVTVYSRCVLGLHTWGVDFCLPRGGNSHLILALDWVLWVRSREWY